MNWAQFFQQQGKLLAQMEASNKRADAIERELREARASLMAANLLLAQQKGAYKAASAIGALVGAIAAIVARVVVGLWQ